ncbi:MAG: IclR family transcriptional regulator [Mycobacterium sp.]
MRIVRAVAAREGGIGLSEVARETGISKATCFRILNVLEEEGWLEADATTRQFRVSLDLFLMVAGQRSAARVSEVIDAILREVAAEVQETCGLDRLDQHAALVLREMRGPHQIGHTPKDVPRRLSAVRTSTGRVMLAHGDRDVARALFEAEADTQPKLPFADAAAFETELDTVLANGFAVCRDELEIGLTAIAVPVRPDNAASFAVWVSGPTFRMNEVPVDATVSILRNAANRLEVLLRDKQLAEAPRT